VQALPFARRVASAQTRATFDVVAGFVYAQTLAALVELDVFRRLSGGPVDTATLARELALPARSVDVLMTAAHAVGLVDRRAKGWGLGLKGAAILGQGGIAEMVAHHVHFYRDLADPVALLRGEGPTALSAFWTYARHAAGEAGGTADPTPYSRLMAASQDFVASAVLHNRVFRRARRLVDLGGGAGAFAVAALKCHANLTVTVADRPDVVPLARAALAEAGLSDRADVHALDFFADALAFEADTITLVRVLHDHEDEAVAALLARLAADNPRARLVVVEPMAQRRGPTGVDAYFPWYFRAMGQGRLRTFDELRSHLRSAGYADVRAVSSRNPTLVRALTASVQSV